MSRLQRRLHWRKEEGEDARARTSHRADATANAGPVAFRSSSPLGISLRHPHRHRYGHPPPPPHLPPSTQPAGRRLRLSLWTIATAATAHSHPTLTRRHKPSLHHNPAPATPPTSCHPHPRHAATTSNTVAATTSTYLTRPAPTSCCHDLRRRDDLRLRHATSTRVMQPNTYASAQDLHLPPPPPPPTSCHHRDASCRPDATALPARSLPARSLPSPAAGRTFTAFTGRWPRVHCLHRPAPPARSLPSLAATCTFTIFTSHRLHRPPPAPTCAPAARHHRKLSLPLIQSFACRVAIATVTTATAATTNTLA